MEHLYNCFGECIDNISLEFEDDVERQFPKPNNDIDRDGFDKHNIESNGEYTIEIELMKGTLISRYGDEGGRFTSPLGTPYECRGLPFKVVTCQYHEYEVIADGVSVQLIVTKGVTAPAFNSKGGGIQYKHVQSISEEIRDGKLREVTSWLKNAR